MGPLKSGGADSFSPRSSACWSLDDMVFIFKAVDEMNTLKSKYYGDGDRTGVNTLICREEGHGTAKRSS